MGESEDFTWVTADGDISNETHFVFYRLIGTFFLVTLLVCCFHEQIRGICQCLLPKRKCQPEIRYEKDSDQVIIESREMLPMVSVYDIHTKTQIPELKTGSKLGPDLAGKAGK